MRKVIVLLLVVLSAITNAASFQGIGDLDGGSYWSRALGVSDDGNTVVGYSNASLGNEAFIWNESEGIQSLGELPGGPHEGGAFDTSADGSIVIGWGNSTLGVQAVQWTNGVMQELEYLPGGGTFMGATHISADGRFVVGWSDSSLGNEAVLWKDGQIQSLGDLPGGAYTSAAWDVSDDGKYAVGAGHNDLGMEAFLWKEGEGMISLGDLPDGTHSSYAYGVSNDGSIVVGGAWADPGLRAFRWTKSEGMTDIGDGRALDISADGAVIVGDAGMEEGYEHAYIWMAGHERMKLKDYLVNDLGLNLDGWLLDSATRVSADGMTIVGYGINPAGQEEGWIARIPKPLVEIAIDIKPHTCPNPLNTKSKGLLTVAILGTTDFDVYEIDPASVTLNGISASTNGVSAIRSRYDDILTSAESCSCDGVVEPDGYPELILKFEVEALVETLGEVNEGDEIELVLTGVLADDTPIEGTDCIVIRGKPGIAEE